MEKTCWSIISPPREIHGLALKKTKYYLTAVSRAGQRTGEKDKQLFCHANVPKLEAQTLRRLVFKGKQSYHVVSF